MKKKESTLSVLAAVFSILTCTLIIALILAIIDLAKKDDSESHKGSVFAIIWFFFITIGGFFVIMNAPSGTGTTSSVVSSTDDNATTSVETQQDTKHYKVGDTIHVNTSNGEYEFTITKVYETDYRNEFAEKQPSRVVMIDYEYKNISYEVNMGDYSNNELFISSLNFTMYDSDGKTIEPYPATTDVPQSISPGHQTSGQMAYGLDNDKNFIEAEFSDNVILGNDLTIDLEW